MDRTRDQRLEMLERSCLYFVSEGRDDRATAELLDAAIRGGCDLIQLRDKQLDPESIPSASKRFRESAASGPALFFINDRPDLVMKCGADGVHVGQDDVSVAEARSIAGPEILVGLSTHGPEQLQAACAARGADRPDYLSVGPIWATPTKPGRLATGLEYADYAAAHSDLPWFAIGGIDQANIDEVIAAGAQRAVVVRAIRDASDPERVAAELSAALGATDSDPKRETSLR